MKNFKFIHMSFTNFTLEKFKSKIMKNFKLNTTYSILLKISSNNNLIFKMCGPQIGLVIGNEHDLDYYSKLYNLILTRIETTVDLYNYLDTIEHIQIMYSIIVNQKDLTLKNLSKYSLKQQMINQKEVKKIFNENMLPFTVDTSYFGYNLLGSERQNLIQLISSNTSFNKNNKENIINESDKIFLYDSPNKKNKFIIVNKKLDKNNFLRLIYDYNTGIFINKIKDTIYLNKSLFKRNIGRVSLTIEESTNKIINYEVMNSLSPILHIEKKSLRDRNLNIGSFDLEAFKDSDGLAKAYALGYFTYLDKEPIIFYLSDLPDLNSQNLILKCIDSMLVNKYHNFIFYVHNLGRYDIVFLYNTFLQANLDKGYDYYIIDTTMRDDTIIKLNIKIKVFSEKDKNKYRYLKISLVDSLNFLNLSLDKLTKEFNIDIRKGYFPHSFVNKNTLNYIGNKPNYSFYKELNIDKNEYNKIPNENWNLKLECLNYLNKDLKGLYEVMIEFSRLVYIYFNVDITDALTITRLSLNIFKKNYYKIHNIPYINKIYLFNFIKQGYYGGITEVYIPYGKDLLYIDINSLYPFAALNSMPGTECNYIESFEDNGLDLDKLFGFFYAKVKTNDSYIGLLPVYLDNRLIFPNGEFYGIWSSEELKFAKSKGYEVIVYKGYNFNKIENIFKDYIEELYNLKKNATGFLKLIYKSLLNNFIGRFGLSITKPITKTVNKDRRDFIFSTRIIHSHKFLNDNKFLITYTPTISKDICLEHGLDFIKVLENESKYNIENSLDLFKDVSIATAAMVTSYARIHINKIKLEILDKGGDIYYSDTDSIVLNKNSINSNWLGNEIGKFKLEYVVKEAFFISNKTYCLVLENGDTIIKTKGIINKSLNLQDFKDMYWNKKYINVTKWNTLTNYEKTSVLIEKKDVILNYDSYTKREKLFNEKGIWINTKPLSIYNNK